MSLIQCFSYRSTCDHKTEHRTVADLRNAVLKRTYWFMNRPKKPPTDRLTARVEVLESRNKRTRTKTNLQQICYY